jgi:hypothetical protein
MLRCETNTRAMERRILRAARVRLARHASSLGPRRFSAAFEHGQWWVTDLTSGAQWSVVDCVGAEGEYFDFERVSQGDEE